MKNEIIFNESKKYMPGGVNSPVRAFRDVDVVPPILKRGSGAYVFDEEDSEYLDFVGAWGPMLLGQSDEDVVEAIQRTSKEGIAFGAPTELELKLARHMCETLDNIEMIRMVNSGTEATMSAVRLARGFTGRDKIVKFAGCYHGHFDAFLVSAGSGVMTNGIPGSLGVLQGTINNTIVARYNSVEDIRLIFENFGEEIAGVIIEPVAGNMGVIKSDKEFLEELEKLCKSYGSLLIFDEVMTGFRVAYKGAQSLYGVKPDLTTYAKIMGGGIPCGAYGGRRDIMEKLSPLGAVYQAGTMSGNPIAMAAGYTTLKKLHDNPSFYENLESIGALLEAQVKELSKEKGISVVVNRCSSMLTIFFTQEEKVANYEDAKKCDTALFAKFFRHMLKEGIYLPPSQFEALFLSVKHTQREVDKFITAMKKF